MGKEVLELPAECEKCGSLYNLNDDLLGEDWNKTISQVLIKKFGSDSFLCSNCRKMVRVVEKGKFNLITTKTKNDEKISLELISNQNRKVFEFSKTEKEGVNFKVIKD